MRKISIALVLLVCTTTAFSQLHPDELQGKITRHRANMIIKQFGYQCANGWTLKNGDTIHLGKGSLPNHGYAYIYRNPGNNQFDGLIHLQAGEATRLVISKFKVRGKKKGGFSGTAKVGIGQFVKYILDIENAVESGEIIVPPEFMDGTPIKRAHEDVDLADKLKKWKELLDNGAITQEEYETQKEKLFNSGM